MTSHLREVIEGDRSGARHIHAFFDDADGIQLWRAFLDIAERAICFDMGDTKSMAGTRSVASLSKLPFPVCWFEATEYLENDRSARWGALLCDHADGSQRGFAFNKICGEPWTLCGAWEGAPLHELNGRISIYGDVDVDERRAIQGDLIYLACFIGAVNCRNINRVEHAPDVKLQRARARRGRLPLFSYWTLEIDATGQPNEIDLGGTHASPRFHLRRGHPRQYAPNKYCWVQAHGVGSTHGMVHKEYKLRLAHERVST